MIAYDKTLLDNVYIDEEANRLKESGFISREQYQSIQSQLPRLKSQNNIFIRIGFFILGCMLYSSICGMISLFGVAFIEDAYLPFIYLFAIIGFVAKEFMSREMKFFGFGLDDAFILGGILALLIAAGLSFQQNYDPNFLIVIIVMAIVSSIAYLRYLNLSLALLACFGITSSLAYITFEYCIIGKSILPFVLLLFSGGCYFIAKKMLQNLTSPYYYKGLKLAKGFCLILFYLAGNYYVVRELNFSLSEDYFYNNQSPEIPFAIFFWAFTISIPVVYLVFSLKNKDRMMLWIGFLALCFAFFTFRTYHHVLPPEVALTIGGLAVFAFTYFTIKKTKHKETGITFKADRFTNPNAFANLQTLVVASQFGLKPEAKVEESPMEFGGGGFSGGGSGGEF
jgi:multisubunit Na+/H+ antiporter MnhF subunit